VKTCFQAFCKNVVQLVCRYVSEDEKARYKEETIAAMDNVQDAVVGGLIEATKLGEDARRKQADERAKVGPLYKLDPVVTLWKRRTAVHPTSTT
jgi:hypothetical protein